MVTCHVRQQTSSSCWLSCCCCNESSRFSSSICLTFFCNVCTCKPRVVAHAVCGRRRLRNSRCSPRARLKLTWDLRALLKHHATRALRALCPGQPEPSLTARHPAPGTRHPAPGTSAQPAHARGPGIRHPARRARRGPRDRFGAHGGCLLGAARPPPFCLSQTFPELVPLCDQG